MIRSFGDKTTERIWHEQRVTIDTRIAEMALRKLQMLSAASSDRDLRIPPSHHFEKLAGRLNGYRSIRVNKKWRLIFIWQPPHADDVRLDPHDY